MRTRSARRERGGDVAPGFPRRDDRQNGPASSARSRGISAPSRLLRLALLVGILVAGAAAPHDPSVDAAAHVGGDVYALALTYNGACIHLELKKMGPGGSSAEHEGVALLKLAPRSAAA